MTETTYPFDRKFRERILALCVTPDWFARFGSQVIRPEYFELEEEKAIAKELLKFFSQYSRTPRQDELLAVFSNGIDPRLRKIKPDIDELVKATYRVQETEPLDFARDKAIQFAKEQAMKLAIEQSIGELQKNDLTKIVGRAQEALRVGDDVTDLGLSLVDDAEKWIEAVYAEKRIQTGIYHLDAAMEGGLGVGELGVLLAGTNVGKTQALVNIGFGAAGIAYHHNVCHITCETSANKVAKRYAARTTFHWLTKEDNSNDYLIEFQRSAKRLLTGHVRIKEFPTKTASVGDVRAYIERLICAGEKPDVVLVDYPGEMKHEKQAEYRHMLAETFRGLRGLAGIFGIPIWAAAQANRAALAKELVDLTDVGESYEIVQICDTVIAICQTDEEYGDDQLRLYAAKIRDGEKEWMIRCHNVKGSHAIISDDFMQVKDLPGRKRKKGEDE